MATLSTLLFSALLHMYMAIRNTITRIDLHNNDNNMTVGIPSKGDLSVEKEKRYVKDTILYDLLEVDPGATQGDRFTFFRSLFVLQFIIVLLVSSVLLQQIT
jgi:hypothetical protein